MMKTRNIIVVTLVGAFVNVLLAIVKIFVGFWFKSQALIADGFHSFSDLVTDFAIIFGASHWYAPPDKTHPYGHGRLETLITLFIGVVLGLISIGIAWKAVVTIGSNNVNIGWPIFFVAVFSIVSKEIIYRWTTIRGRVLNSTALLANAKHHRSDALSSIPIVVAFIIHHIFPNIFYLDNLAALLIAAMLFRATFQIIWPVLNELMEANLGNDLEIRIQNYSKKNDKIKEIHKIRTRRMGGAILVDLHMLVDPIMTVRESHNLAASFKSDLIKSESKVVDILIHIEPYENSD